jgi:two-component system response regulator RegA
VRIILVEDDDQLRERLARALRARGHDAVEAADRRAAGQAALTAFDAAVVDLRLGRESGLDVVGDLSGTQPGALVVLVTGNVTREVAEQARKKGAASCLAKPFDADELLRVLKGVDA